MHCGECCDNRCHAERVRLARIFSNQCPGWRFVAAPWIKENSRKQHYRSSVGVNRGFALQRLAKHVPADRHHVVGGQPGQIFFGRRSSRCRLHHPLLQINQLGVGAVFHRGELLEGDRLIFLTVLRSQHLG